MDTKEETVTITKKEYDRLVKADLHLGLLQSLGVDNWTGYCSLPDRRDYDTEQEWRDAINKAAEGY